MCTDNIEELMDFSELVGKIVKRRDGSHLLYLDDEFRIDE